MKTSEFVKNDQIARFAYYRAQTAYYTVMRHAPEEPNHQDIYTFPVDLEDIGNATLERDIKSITLMRYIRKAIDSNTMRLGYQGGGNE